MNEQFTKPQYYNIALDIASRIAKGELSEGKKIYGRSVISSEYGVSPETIRRALKLLSDMGVLEIRPQSCAVVSSMAEAQKYVNRHQASPDIQQLNSQLRTMLNEQAALGKRIAETATEISKIDKKMLSSSPFPNYEVRISKNSPVLGKNLQELQFWQATGATIIAIRRQSQILLSPGPYATLQENDVVIFIGGSDSVQAVAALVGETI